MSDETLELVTLEDQWRGVARVDPVLVQQLVEFCNQRVHRAALEAWLAVAERLVRDLWNGDLDAALEKSAEKHATWRALLAHEQLRVDRSMVSRCRGLLRLREQLAPYVFHGLPVTHHFILIPIHDAEVRRELATRAYSEDWDRDRLRLEASAHKGTHVPREITIVRRAIGAIGRVDVDALVELPPEAARLELRALDESLGELRRRVRAALAVLPKN